MLCPNCKIGVRSGTEVCRICGAKLPVRRTLDETLGLNDPAVRQGLLITASVLIGVILLGVVARGVLVGMQEQSDLNAAARAEQIKRAKDPTLPIAIGDDMDKVTKRCGDAKRVNSMKDSGGTWYFLEYEYSSSIPYDCVGSHSFKNFELVRTIK